MCLGEIGYDDVNWVELSKDRAQWQASILVISNIRVILLLSY
jgi:hypothetical protein